jgi:hypothetical protein
VIRYRAWYYNPYGEDGKKPFRICIESMGKKYVCVDDTLDGKVLIMSHWEPEENVDK